MSECILVVDDDREIVRAITITLEGQSQYFWKRRDIRY